MGCLQNRWLLSAIDPGWDKYGIEPSRKAGAVAATHANIEIGTFEDAEVKNKTFDLIVMYHVIEHMQNPIDVLRSAQSMLRPEGHMILGTPDFDSGAARRYGANYRLLHDPTHISLFSNDSIPWAITAKHGRLLPESTFREEAVELWENVLAIKQQPDGRFINIQTESLTVYPERDYAETNKKVYIDDNNARTTAAGMQANFNQGRFVFFSTSLDRVNTVYLPAHRR